MNTRRVGRGFLLLEDGRRFDGEALHVAEQTPRLGEVVFNTSHSGYQEILSDPSYRGQLVVFTTPHIGNVGTNDDDLEAERPMAAGAILRALASAPRSWRSRRSLAEWLHDGETPLLAGVDTRSVTLHVREAGAMRAGIFSADLDESEALRQVRGSPSMAGMDLASSASCQQRYEVAEMVRPNAFRSESGQGRGLHVALMDFGVKRSIIQELTRRGCRVTVMPASISADVLDGSDFDGVLLSNGPGDPAAAAGLIETVERLLEQAVTESRPLFGICLGHQLLALAAGMETFKLPFGHRGANHPVRNELSGVVEITSQNHGFAVKPDTIGGGFRVTHVNLNDGTVEGLAHESAPVFSIQYHPESSPGPLDSVGYFDRFIEMMRPR